MSNTRPEWQTCQLKLAHCPIIVLVLSQFLIPQMKISLSGCGSVAEYKKFCSPGSPQTLGKSNYMIRSQSWCPWQVRHCKRYPTHWGLHRMLSPLLQHTCAYSNNNNRWGRENINSAKKLEFFLGKFGSLPTAECFS